MSDEVIANRILKFVCQLDGVEGKDNVLEAAIARRWLDHKGLPTADGRELVSSLNMLQRIGRPAKD